MHYDIKEGEVNNILPLIKAELSDQKLATVFCSGRTKNPKYLAQAAHIAELLWNERRLGIVNGDGTRSMMGTVANHSGYAVGVAIPDSLALESDPTVPNHYKINILCEDIFTRIALMTELGGILISSIGGFGTFMEDFEVIKASQRHVIFDNFDGFYNGLIAQIAKSCGLLNMPLPFLVANNDDELLDAIDKSYGKKPENTLPLFDPLNPHSLEGLRVIMAQLVDLQINPLRHDEKINIVNEDCFYDDFIKLYQNLLSTDLISAAEKRLIAKNVMIVSPKGQLIFR